MKNKVFIFILFWGFILSSAAVAQTPVLTNSYVDTSTTLKATTNTNNVNFKPDSYKLINKIGNIDKICDTGKPEYNADGSIRGCRELTDKEKEEGETGGFSDFVNFIIRLAIAMAGAITVVMIMVYGVQYMGSDTVWKKSDSRSKITTAIAGLILMFCAYLILYTINPDLVKIRIGGNLINTRTWPVVSFTYGEDGNIIKDFNYDKATSVKDTCQGEPNEKVTGDCSDLTISGWETKNGKYASKELAERLAAFKKLLDQNSKIKGNYRITEAMPQSVKHKNSCHKTGRCVDFAFTDSNLYNDIDVLTYIDQSANKSKLCTVFEGQTGDAMVKKAKDLGLGAGTYSWVTGRHFSIYGWTGCAKK